MLECLHCMRITQHGIRAGEVVTSNFTNLHNMQQIATKLINT
jgi:hypothetical protein